MSDSAVDIFDRGFRLRVVASLLCFGTRRAMRVASMLKPHWLEDDSLADIAEVAINHLEKYKRPPTRYVLKHECGADVMSLPAVRKIWKVTESDADWCIDRLADFCRVQAVKQATIETAELIRENRPVTVAVCDKFRDAISVGMEFGSNGERFSDIAGRAAMYTDPEDSDTIPTGFDHLDQIMQGGIGRGEIGSVLASTGKGKSWVLMNIGFHAAARRVGPEGQSYNVAHATFELRTKKLLRRYDMRLTAENVAMAKENPQAYVRYLRRQHSISMSKVNDVRVNYWPTRSVGVAGLRDWLLRLQDDEDFKTDLLIVDYADVMKADRQMENVRDEQTRTYEDLRGLAGELDCGCWTGTQANRTAVDKEVVTVKEVGEAFGKMQAVDACIAVCRTQEEVEEHRGRFFIAKGRDFGDGMTITASMDFRKGLIETDGIVNTLAVTKKDSQDKTDSHIERAMEKASRRRHNAQLRGG